MGKGVFFTSASILLAVVITATLRHHHHHHQHPNDDSSPTTYAISNCSKLLRSNGFNLIANFLHISPELILSTPQTTIFAVPDAAIAKLSIPPYMIKHLLAYHISPAKLTSQDLFNKPLKTCLPTLIRNHPLSITKSDHKKQLLEINNVLITHPDLFMQGHLAIHGLDASFASLSFDHNHQEQLVTLPLPLCEPVRKRRVFINNTDEWGRMVKFLSSAGFVRFVTGLNSVTDWMVQEFPDLNSVTIFTPPNNVGLIGITSSPLLEKFMRFHMVPLRHSFKQLVGLPSLSTMLAGKQVDITRNSKVSHQVMMSINGVAITAPDLFVSKSLVVHGIARPLNLEELSRVSR